MPLTHSFTGGQYPVLPLRTEVHLPGRLASLEIGRDTSIRAVEAAAKDDNQIVVIPQRNPATRDVNPRDLVEVGVLSEIVQVVKHSPGRFTAVVRFGQRVKVDGIVAAEPFLVAAVSPLPIKSSVPDSQLVAMAKEAREHLAILIAESHSRKESKDKGEGKEAKESKEPREERSQLHKETAREALSALAAVTDPDLVVDHAVPYIDLDRDDLLALLL